MDKLFQLVNWWYGVNKVKAELKEDDKPLRFGVLSAAAINYPAIVDPIQTHPGATLVAIAARDKARAQAQIDNYGVGAACKAYGSYAELLQNPDVDAVYIPLPNGLHCEWTIKSLEAGKHVLLEKPFTSNAEQARQVREAAEKSGKVVLEAFHWRFHPASHHVKSIIDSGKYGALQSISVDLRAPGGFIKKGDIRLNYSLAGGAAMDLTYVFSSSTFFSCSPVDFPKSNVKILEADPRLCPDDKKVDEAMESRFVIEQSGKPPVECNVQASLTAPPLFGFIPRIWVFTSMLTLELEKAKIDFDGFVLQNLGHKITITDKETGKKEVQKQYVDGPLWGKRGQPWWSTYRYQLEAFVEKVKADEAGKEYQGPWMSLDESQKLMEVIDSVYDKAGLPRRGL